MFCIFRQRSGCCIHPASGLQGINIAEQPGKVASGVFDDAFAKAVVEIIVGALLMVGNAVGCAEESRERCASLRSAHSISASYGFLRINNAVRMAVSCQQTAITNGATRLRMVDCWRESTLHSSDLRVTPYVVGFVTSPQPTALFNDYVLHHNQWSIVHTLL